MKLDFDCKNRCQPDPFIFNDGDKYYLYVTATKGVETYSADDIFGVWHYEGIVTKTQNATAFWAPSIIRVGNVYYLYVSFNEGENFQFMHVLSSNSPLGPFENPIQLYDYFSIDSHVVQTSSGLFILFAKDNTECERRGTRVYIDRLLDPVTPEHHPHEVILPTFDEEVFNHRQGKPWYTIEGPFWFCSGDWQYLMYSGGCYENDTYHVGYCCAKTNESDLTKVNFIKKTDKFAPVLIKNDFEEGTGHNSVIKYKGEYYTVYHARDYGETCCDKYVETRTARICKLIVKDGSITAEMYKDKV